MVRTIVKTVVVLIVVVLPCVLFSITVARSVTDSELNALFATYLFPAANTFLSSTLGAVALYFVVLYSLSSSSSGLSIESDKVKRVTSSLGQNIIWCIVFFAVMLSIPVYKTQGIIILEWSMLPIDVDRLLAINSVWILLICLIGFTTFDTIYSTFSILRQALFFG